MYVQLSSPTLRPHVILLGGAEENPVREHRNGHAQEKDLGFLLAE